MDINLNWFKYFIAVMECGTITAAARHLGVSQPSVSYNINALEASLQVRLFEVGRHGIEPVAPALSLYQHIKDAYHELVRQIETLVTVKDWKF